MKQKYARGQTMGAYSNLYALLKAYSPGGQPENQFKNLTFKKKVRRKKLQIKYLFRTGRKDIRKYSRWKGLVDVSVEGYIQKMKIQSSTETGECSDELNSEDEEDERDMIEYLNRPYISLDESLIADCSPDFIRRNYHALRSLCSIEMKSKQQVYLYQDNGCVFYHCFSELLMSTSTEDIKSVNDYFVKFRSFFFYFLQISFTIKTMSVSDYDTVVSEQRAPGGSDT